MIAIPKIICGLPKCTQNIVTQLPHYMFGIQACSLHNAYLRCIGQELRNVQNDKGELRIIYTGLTYFILAKHGGAANIPTIKHQHCIYPPLEHPSYFQLHGVKFFISTTALSPRKGRCWFLNSGSCVSCSVSTHFFESVQDYDAMF